MQIISHRGNLTGPQVSLENDPEQILKCLKLFEVEVDVRLIDGSWFLGHDHPQHKIPFSFFTDKMWIHCKNKEAIEKLQYTSLNWFWHDKDDMTVTSKGIIWCAPGIYVRNAITVEPSHKDGIPDFIKGICSDYPMNYL
jgi:hypothetical protein